ncbi:primosomal protein N' [bacterium]|nr:primosomal protein N' [bacterium]
MQLTDEQKNALDIIRQKQFNLVHGVTGSGKTEIYLRATQEVVDLGKKAIVLVPEISLTPQTIARFSSRFNIAVIHSRLTPKQRKEAWQKIVNNEVDVVVGARSAIFAPFGDLGLIVVDEEHDSSFKQDNNPRYSLVDVAIKRAALAAAKLILGSATPSLESYYLFKNSNNQDYAYINLKSRVLNRKMPEVEIIDMREEIKEKNFSIFSKKLREAISDRLKKKEQIILFLNRRGFSSFVSCRSCGFVLECDRCNVSMTYHQDDHVHCHYCNKKIILPKRCPKCDSKYFKHFGVGTQRVEMELTKHFGDVRVLRMDKDTVKKRTAHEDILKKFQEGEADILLGTQMIAKGHDFWDVTLVGVIAADVSLHLPDFRAGERTFQLLSQVAGRTGRGEKGGEVIIQTYTPDNYAIQAAANHDYQTFYEEEIKNREECGYPPFSKLTSIVVSAPNEQIVTQEIKTIAQKYPKEKILGPVPSPLSKLRGFYRWQMLLKDQEVDYHDFKPENKVKIEIDVDPVNMY